jgi:serine/threonine-protein kinase
VSLLDLDYDHTAGLSALLPPNSPAIERYLEGVGALKANDAGASIVSLELVSSDAPEFAPARTALGRAYWQEYRNTGEDEVYERSIRHLAAAADLAPRAWQPRFHLGDIYRLTGEIDRAISVFNAVLEDDPGNTLVCRRLSDAYSRQERNEEAERTLKAAVKAYPDYFETHRLLARLYYGLGEEEATLQALRVSKALAPEDAYTYNLYGVVYHDRGDYTEARKAFERAFQLLPMCHTCSNVGLMLYYEGRFKDSAEYYEYALEYCGRDSHEIWANWARSLYWVDGERERSGDLFAEAIQLATEALRSSPEDPFLIGNLIESYAMTGDSTSALRMIALAESLPTKDAELLYSIGDAYELMGDRNAALRYLSAAARHGFPIDRIRATRELQDLVSDSRFKRMVAALTDEEGSPPATSE